jgi:hypothetical protein
LDLTANHPVYVEGKGFVNALTLVPKRDIIKVCEIEESMSAQIVGKKLPNLIEGANHAQPVIAGLRENLYVPSLYSMDGVIINSQMDTGVLDAIQGIIYYIEISGKQIMVRFRRDVQFIISMATQAITELKTSLRCLLNNIKATIILGQRWLKKQGIGWGIVNALGGHCVNSRHIFANNAARNSLVEKGTMSASVLLPVTQNGGIESIEPGPKLPVYNLEVEGSPEYFANGILVHNCKVFHTQAFEELEDQLTTWTPEVGKSPDRLDALVWAITELMPPPPEPLDRVIVYDTMAGMEMDI